MGVPPYKTPCSIGLMNTFSERVQEVADEVGGQSELARRVGNLMGREVKPGAINNLCRPGPKQARHSAYSPYIAKAGNVRLEWLISGTGPKRDEASPAPNNYCSVPFLEQPDTYGPMMFSRPWLESKGLDPERLRIYVAKDDSLGPAIPKSSMVLIDCSRTVPEHGNAYLIRLQDRLLLKRAFLQLDGRWLLRYDNPDKTLYPDDILSPEQTRALDILGQVVTPMGIA